MTPDELKAYADEHLFYEISMLSALVDRFDRFKDLLASDPPEDDPYAAEVWDVAGRNANVESFGIHARNLMAFLFESGSHLNADDFFEERNGWSSGGFRPKPTPTALKEINQRVAKELAHLTKSRPATARDWGYAEIWHELAPLIERFIENASSDRLSREFYETVKALLPADDRKPASARDVLEASSHIRAAVGATTAPPYLLTDRNMSAPEDSGGTAIIRIVREKPGFGD